MNDPYRAFLRKKEYQHWKGFSNKDRNAVINEIENIINRYGFITDFHMFTDMEICIKIETEEQNLYPLYSDLKNQITLNDYIDINSKSKKEHTIFLNITFLNSTGNLKIEVPAVPG